jgi:hypothetical protein
VTFCPLLNDPSLDAVFAHSKALYEAMNMIRKGQIKEIEKGDVIGQISFINEVFGVAA